MVGRIIGRSVGDVQRAALDVVFPIRCFGCGAAGRYICAECVEALPKLERPYCDVCASPGVRRECGFCSAHPLAVDAIRSPYLYTPDSPIHRAITSLKYRGLRSVAPELADLLAEFVSRLSGASSSQSGSSGDVAIPVPSHPSRMRRRGYGQASLIASELGERLGIPVDADSLSRIVNAPSQLETESREERWTRARANFECAAKFDDANVLLVDDLVTTGSTASACAAALKDAGARRVVAVSVARAP